LPLDVSKKREEREIFGGEKKEKGKKRTSKDSVLSQDGNFKSSLAEGVSTKGGGERDKTNYCTNANN